MKVKNLALQIFVTNLMCLLVQAVPTSFLKYEEYVIEHEVSATQARNSVLHMNLENLGTRAGCQKCTESEKNYCLGNNFISDHCCCDRKHHEVLPYVPHTCYLGPQLCDIHIGDCIKYETIRTCCCQKYVFEKWKRKSSSNKVLVTPKHVILLSILSIYLL